MAKEKETQTPGETGGGKTPNLQAANVENAWGCSSNGRQLVALTRHARSVRPKIIRFQLSEIGSSSRRGSGRGGGTVVARVQANCDRDPEDNTNPLAGSEMMRTPALALRDQKGTSHSTGGSVMRWHSRNVRPSVVERRSTDGSRPTAIRSRADETGPWIRHTRVVLAKVLEVERSFVTRVEISPGEQKPWRSAAKNKELGEHDVEKHLELINLDTEGHVGGREGRMAVIQNAHE
ncbi:hypothetical protein B0H11DRAFT_1906391 [Mycena galericulata]|nr:hypothetical protein B0H11DRAFT_1906391 [Mycena galericulata]